MKQDQHTLVICVSPGLKGRWDVSEKGLEEPLASFDEKEDAYAYADNLKNTHARATVLVEDKEGFFLMPPLENDRGRSAVACGDY